MCIFLFLYSSTLLFVTISRIYSYFAMSCCCRICNCFYLFYSWCWLYNSIMLSLSIVLLFYSIIINNESILLVNLLICGRSDYIFYVCISSWTCYLVIDCNCCYANEYFYLSVLYLFCIWMICFSHFSFYALKWLYPFVFYSSLVINSNTCFYKLDACSCDYFNFNFSSSHLFYFYFAAYFYFYLY